MIFDVINNIEPLVDPVYNFKYNYIRVNGGYFNSETLYCNFYNSSLDDSENKNRLFIYLSRFLHYQKKYDLPVKFDCAMEADNLVGNLQEKEAIEILDWINEWKDIHKLKTNSIIFLTNAIDVKKITPPEYRDLVESFHKYRFYCSPCLDVNYLHKREFDKTFFVPMRRPSKPRTTLYNFLKQNDIIKNCFYSYNVPHGDGIVPIQSEDTFAIERYYADIPKNNYNFDEVFSGLRLMKKSFCHIIMETIFKDEIPKQHHLIGGHCFKEERFFTEKTFKSIMACQPFILGSNSKDLERLRSFGFKTFSDWWDESYDIMPDKERMEAIQSLIYEINKWDYDKIKTVYNEMIPILIHNYENVKTLDDRFKEFQNNTIYTVMEGYEYPLSYYDFQEENIVDNSWKILT